MLLMTIYATGLRISEATHLRARDIDSQRMVIHVHGGKGATDRLVPLSPVLLRSLREYWKLERPQAWLFPGIDPQRPVSRRSIATACVRAGQSAGLKKHVTPHTLRNASAYYTPFGKWPISRQIRFVRGSVFAVGGLHALRL
jgi:site-specific recombinase XerD